MDMVEVSMLMAAMSHQCEEELAIFCVGGSYLKSITDGEANQARADPEAQLSLEVALDGRKESSK